MIDEATRGHDPLESVAVRPATLSQRRLVAVIGGLALVAAAGLLVLELGKGATPVAPGAELEAAARARAKAGVPPR
jgi:hypothetical protein